MIQIHRPEVDENTAAFTEELAPAHTRRLRLRDFENKDFDRGRSKFVETLWLLISALFVASPVPGSAMRCVALRAFGARIGKRVILKPGVRVKFPWKLSIGDDTWIGEDAWIDNLAEVSIGDNCCISQGAYLCTGSHDWSSPTFDLITKPIVLRDGAWIAARAMVCPGVTAEEGAVLTLGSVASSRLEAWNVYQGVPALRVKRRETHDRRLG